jgi:hypothetical protein
MIHRAEAHEQPQSEVGWGHFEVDVEALTTCEDDEAIVLFQGELPVGTHLRAPVPLPTDGALDGMVTLSATLAIAPETDPEHPGAYTRSGLEVKFRPNIARPARRGDGTRSQHADTISFFSPAGMYGGSEFAMREGGHKWEPCQRRARRFQARTLNRPCFDVYYHHREGGVAPETQQPIRYALIVGIKAPRVVDLYSRVVRSYQNILLPLRPLQQIPIRP